MLRRPHGVPAPKLPLLFLPFSRKRQSQSAAAVETPRNMVIAVDMLTESQHPGYGRLGQQRRRRRRSVFADTTVVTLALKRPGPLVPVTGLGSRRHKARSRTHLLAIRRPSSLHVLKRRSSQALWLAIRNRISMLKSRAAFSWVFLPKIARSKRNLLPAALSLSVNLVVLMVGCLPFMVC